MFKHFIVLGSSYSTGERIALDYVDVDLAIFNKISKLINKKNDNYTISTQIITTDTKEWADVVARDPFFENVKLLKNEKEFLKYLSKNEELTAVDVANYIIANYECSHTRLEKLVYFCYADYLCNYNKKLFKDKIYAFKYGPVVQSIYKKFKNEEKPYKLNKKFDMPIQSKILNSNDGMEKLDSINETLNKYKSCTANELIALTHRDDTPWAMNGKGEKEYKLISDKDVLKYHKNEVL